MIRLGLVILRHILAGGTFALYSLLCRHAKLSLILNQQAADAELSTYKLEQPPETPRGQYVRKLLEKYSFLRTGLLFIVLMGTCMVLSDGILTPSIAGVELIAFESCFFTPTYGVASEPFKLVHTLGIQDLQWRF